MSALKAANLGLAFLLELAALIAFIDWGVHAETSTIGQIVLAIGTPLIAAVLWGIWMAPNSSRRFRGTPYLVFKLVFFGLAIAALVVAGSPTLALIFAIVFVLNTALLYIWHQE